MNKGFVDRSQFQFITLTDNSPKTVLVEGDEAYITVMNSNGSSALIRRQVERDQQKAIAASGLVAGASCLSEWNNLDYLYGKVPLDVQPTGNAFRNQDITTTAGAFGNVERIRNSNVGFKEYVDIKTAGTAFPLNICIETVHYIPADSIAA